jgi:hypothetical protein
VNLYLVASASILVATLLDVHSPSNAQSSPGEPRRIHVSSAAQDLDAQLAPLVAEIRRNADAFVFLAGGASNMQEDDRRQLLGMLDALSRVAKSGRRIAVGDGGTQAGIMEAAGLVRRTSGRGFPLIGVAPAPEIPPRGKTPVDPNHSHVVAVDNPSAPAQDAWGSETETMYRLFSMLAEGRPSVAIVANGGGITLAEVDANVRAGRQIILIENSGRAADAVLSLLRKTTPSEPEAVTLRERAEKAMLTRRPELFEVVPLSAGAEGLAAAISTVLGKSM